MSTTKTLDLMYQGNVLRIVHIDSTFSIPGKTITGARAGWSDGSYSLVETPPPPPLPEPTPEERRANMQPLTPRQLLIGLVLNGIDADIIDEMISDIEDPLERAIAKIEWEKAGQINRLHPLILAAAHKLSLTPEHIDVMWRELLKL